MKSAWRKNKSCKVHSNSLYKNEKAFARIRRKPFLLSEVLLRRRFSFNKEYSTRNTPTLSTSVKDTMKTGVYKGNCFFIRFFCIRICYLTECYSET